MKQNLNYLTDLTIKLSITTAIIILTLLCLILSCEKDTQANVPDNSLRFPLAASAPSDSIYYLPVSWGAELRILPNTISQGVRKGVPYWQAKSFAWQRIEPTRYQQDSLKERVVFADMDTIGVYDTFYICRKIKL